MAKEEPLWEFGLGVGAIAFEDYRGSDTAHVYPLPVPYIVYNGTFLKADRDGVRGTLFNQDRFELNLSFNATTPVRNDRERSGMPDLKSTVELGPSFDLHLLRSDDARVKLDLRMPLRAAVTVEAAPQSSAGRSRRGSLWMCRIPLGFAGWNLGLLTGPLFADRRYHDYFYSVAPQFATATRPPYQARAAMPARSSSLPYRNAFPSSGWARTCATTLWPAPPSSTAPWCSAKAIGSGGIRILLDDQQVFAHGRSPRLSAARCRVLFKIAYEYFALYSSLTLLGLICLTWSVFALPLYFLLPRRMGTAVGRRGIMSGFRIYAWSLSDHPHLPSGFARHRRSSGLDRR